MDRDELRLWIDQRRLAAQRERHESSRDAERPSQAFARGLAMIALAGRLLGWPVPEDERDRAQDERAYERWARLRGQARAG